MQQLNNSFILICLQFPFLLSAFPRTCAQLSAFRFLSLFPFRSPPSPHDRVHCEMFKKFEINCSACLPACSFGSLVRLLPFAYPTIPSAVLFSAVS